MATANRPQGKAKTVLAFDDGWTTDDQERGELQSLPRPLRVAIDPSDVAAEYSA
jgi:hypothetical protein